MKSKMFSVLILFYLGLSSSVHGAKLDKGTWEIGGNVAGSYTSRNGDYHAFLFSLNPFLGYYFAKNFFGEFSPGFQYDTTWRTGGNPIRGFSLNPTLYAGVYFRISDTMVISLPIGISVYGYWITDPDYYSEGWSRMITYYFRPALKIQLNENVLFSPYVLTYLRYYRSDYDLFSTAVGFSWSYIW